jgi:hypothetical protein
MASLGRMTFTGKSGRTYQFKVFPFGTRFRKRSGVYVIGSRTIGVNGSHRIEPIYVGRTEDFSQPFEKHHKAKGFAEEGADCICVQSDTAEESRLAKEQDLVAALHPSCND